MTTASTGDDREVVVPEQTHQGDIPSDTLSNRLLLARTHAGFLTVKEAAERCGLNYGSWSNWEGGARPRDLLDVVRKIANGLDINYEWLLFGGPLLPARGRPTRRSTKRTAVDNCGYRPSPSRPTAGRPKRRTDPLRPMSPTVAGRRANYVDPNRAAEAVQTCLVQQSPACLS